MTDDKLATIFAEIRQFNEAQHTPAGAFTRQDYAAAMGISDQVATTEIDRAVEAGLVEDIGRRLGPSGKWVRAFRWKE